AGGSSTGERVLLVYLRRTQHLSHHQISREGGDVRYHQSSGDPRQRRRQHGVWGEWVQRAVVAQYQLSRAVPAPRPSPNSGAGIPAPRVGAEWGAISADDHDSDGADRATAGGSAGVPEI